MKLMKIVSLVMATIICLNSSLVIAATSKEQQLKDKKNSITKTQSEIKQNEQQQKSVRSEINSLDVSINDTEVQISDTQNKISAVERNIKDTEEDIVETQAEYDAKYELRKNRMVAYYKVGTVSLEESVSKIEEETDRMYMEKAIERVVNYDTNLINELESLRIELEKKKALLDSQKVELAELKSSLETKLASLESTLSKRESYLASLKSDHAELEKSVDEMKKEADKLTKEIQEAAAAAARAKKTSSTYKGGKMTWPLPGYYIITSAFGNRLHPILKVYKLHTGVDLAGSGCNGKPVVAAADGTVIVAKYNSAYGNYIVIDHGGGITTLYAHSSKLEVKVGDTVKAGQEIMKVGTTGYSTGPHLHFEVRENGTYVDPIGKGYIKA